MFLTFYFISFIKVDYIKLGKIISEEKTKKKKRKEKSYVIPLSKAIIVTTFISVHNENGLVFFFFSFSFLFSKSTARYNGSLSKDNPIYEQLFQSVSFLNIESRI